MTDEETTPVEEIAEAEASGDETRVGSGTGKRLSDETWEEIRRIYEHDEASGGVTELAARFSVSKQAIHQHFRKHKVVRGSKKKKAIEEGTKKSIGAEEWARQRAERIAQVRTAQFQSNLVLQAEVMKIVAESRAAGTPIHLRSADVKTLDKAADVLTKTRNALMEVLDAANYVDDVDLPTLLVDDLSQAQIEEARKGADEDDLGAEDLEDLAGDEDEVVIEGEDPS